MKKVLHSLIFLFSWCWSSAMADAYRTEDFIYAYTDLLTALSPVNANNDGMVVLDLVDPSNLASTISISFPTRLGTIVYRHPSTKHLGEHPWGIPLSTESDFEDRPIQKAKLLRETQDVEVIFETWDIDDVLAWGVMQETLVNFDINKTKPADSLYVGLPLKRYNQSLMRKESITLEDVLKRLNLIEVMTTIFPEKAKQKIDEMKEDLKVRLGVDKFVMTPPTLVSQSDRCTYDYAITLPPSHYSYELASVILYGNCVVAGIEFLVLRTTYHDVQSSYEDLPGTLVSSLNYIEETLQNISIDR